MKREYSGAYEESIIGGEKVRTFVPSPLPPVPSIQWTPELQILYEEAVVALGRLDGMSDLLPNSELFIYSYVRKEAVLSSQIEGTQSSLADIFSYEAGASLNVDFDDIQEVSNYVAAMNLGLERIKNKLPLCSRLLKEVHEILMKSGRGSSKQPGEFRRSQNWIGGSRPGNANFVPPPFEHVDACMTSLEKFINNIPEKSPTLLKAALAHVQFKTIHPFLDGNGRIGRLLISLILYSEKILKEPLLYLSLYFKENRDEYYRLLQDVRVSGDWESWIQYFLKGVRDTANGATITARRILTLFVRDREILQNNMKRQVNTAFLIMKEFEKSPYSSVKDLATKTGLTHATLNKALESMAKLKILEEITGKKRNRIFRYTEYMNELMRG